MWNFDRLVLELKCKIYNGSKNRRPLLMSKCRIKMGFQ